MTPESPTTVAGWLDGRRAVCQRRTLPVMNTPPASPRFRAAPGSAPRSTAGEATHYAADAYAYSLAGGLIAARAQHREPMLGAHGDAAPMAHGDATPVAAPGHDALRTLLVTDAACDLPEAWLAARRVLVLPLRIRNSRGSQTDGRNGAADSERRQRFFDHELNRAEPDAQALPLSVVGTGDCVHERLLDDTDFVLEIAQASRRSNAYMNSLTAAQNLMLQHGRARRQRGIARPFKMWVIDSTCALNGQGVLVCEGARLLDDGATVPRVVQQIDGLRQHVRTLLVPADVSFFQRRSRLDGDAPLAWLSYGVGKVFDRTPLVRVQGAELSVVVQLRGFDAAIARAFESVGGQVRAGLAAPFICISYAGDEAEVRQWPAFAALQEDCQRHNVTLHLASMSMGNALLVGRGALAVSFASDP